MAGGNGGVSIALDADTGCVVAFALTWPRGQQLVAVTLVDRDGRRVDLGGMRE